MQFRWQHHFQTRKIKRYVLEGVELFEAVAILALKQLLTFYTIIKGDHWVLAYPWGVNNTCLDWLGHAQVIRKKYTLKRVAVYVISIWPPYDARVYYIAMVMIYWVKIPRHGETMKKMYKEKRLMNFILSSPWFHFQLILYGFWSYFFPSLYEVYKKINEQYCVKFKITSFP